MTKLHVELAAGFVDAFVEDAKKAGNPLSESDEGLLRLIDKANRDNYRDFPLDDKDAIKVQKQLGEIIVGHVADLSPSTAFKHRLSAAQLLDDYGSKLLGYDEACDELSRLATIGRKDIKLNLEEGFVDALVAEAKEKGHPLGEKDEGMLRFFEKENRKGVKVFPMDVETGNKVQKQLGEIIVGHIADLSPSTVSKYKESCIQMLDEHGCHVDGYKKACEVFAGKFLVAKEAEYQELQTKLEKKVDKRAAEASTLQVEQTHETGEMFKTAPRLVDGTDVSYYVDKDNKMQIEAGDSRTLVQAQGVVNKDLETRQKNGEKLDPAEVQFMTDYQAKVNQSKKDMAMGNQK